MSSLPNSRGECPTRRRILAGNARGHNGADPGVADAHAVCGLTRILGAVFLGGGLIAWLECPPKGRCKIGWIIAEGGRTSYDVWLDLHTGEGRLRRQADDGVLHHVPWLKDKRAVPAERMDPRAMDPTSPTRCSLW